MATCKTTRISLRIAALHLLPLMMLVTLAAPAAGQAQDAISELAVIYGGSSSIPPPAGYTKIPTDLNQGAGGDYIYLCYKRGVGAPVTGIAVTLGQSTSPPGPIAWTRINVDLNRNAGGDYVYLWYTKDPSCTVLQDVVVLVNTQTPPAGYTLIPVDLNRNAGGAYLYFAYRMN